MARIEYSQYGGPQVMRLAEVAQPVPAESDIAVQVKAAGLNPIDRKFATANSRCSLAQYSRGLGRDFAGVVTAVARA